MAKTDDKPKPKVPPEKEPKPDPDDDDQDDDKTDWKAEAEKWKALSRKHEGEAKALKPAADKLKELEEADKTELEKVQAQLADLTTKLSAQERDGLRARIALRKGLSEAQAKRLVGDTEEELEADADELLEAWKPANEERKPAPKGNERPRENLRPGAKPESEPLKPEDTDPIKLAEMVPR